MDSELEIAFYAGDDGAKRVNFRGVANTYRILGSGRRAESVDEN